MMRDRMARVGIRPPGTVVTAQAEMALAKMAQNRMSQTLTLPIGRSRLPRRLVLTTVVRNWKQAKAGRPTMVMVMVAGCKWMRLPTMVMVRS